MTHKRSLVQIQYGPFQTPSGQCQAGRDRNPQAGETHPAHRPRSDERHPSKVVVDYHRRRQLMTDRHPKTITRIPRLFLHKGTGQARAKFRGRDHYFGRYGSPEAHRR